MNQKKVFSLSTSMTILLVMLCALMGSAFHVDSGHGQSSHDERELVTISDFHFNKEGFASSDWSFGGIEFSGKVDGEYISQDFVDGLQSLKREIRVQIAVCSRVQILFGIREIIYPSHFFW